MMKLKICWYIFWLR